MLRTKPMNMDEVTHRSGEPSSVVSATLTMLELSGLVRQAGSMMYVAVPGQRRDIPTDTKEIS
jgi:predicted transcriptional regulator